MRISNSLVTLKTNMGMIGLDSDHSGECMRECSRSRNLETNLVPKKPRCKSKASVSPYFTRNAFTPAYALVPKQAFALRTPLGSRG